MGVVIYAEHRFNKRPTPKTEAEEKVARLKQALENSRKSRRDDHRIR